MSWIKSIKGIAVAIAIASVLLIFWQLQSYIDSLNKEIDRVKSQNTALQIKFDTAAAFNNSLNGTILSMSQQLVDAQVADDWVRKFDAAMAARLKEASEDIGNMINEKSPDYIGCSGSFSDAVYQRMLDVYQSAPGR
ncbi:hypothetical protein D2H34_004556 [Vibrio fluvialis]